MSMTNYLENKILEATLKNISYASPSTVYLSLHSTANTDAAAGTELSFTNGYGRNAITFGSASNGTIQNTSAVTFTTTGSDWTRAVSVGIYDSSTGGNMLYWSSIVPKTVKSGKPVTFAIGDIKVTID